MAHLEHPYEDLAAGDWISGNLHAHSTNSDGERTMQEVVDVYAEMGHGFLMISDHDTFTAESELSACDSRGMTLIPGNEISANGPHLLHVGGEGFVEPDADRQKVVDNVNSGGGFAVFNHPNWQASFSHCPQELLEECTNYVGLEIYNGVISRLAGSPYATNRWDMLLSQGRRSWGFANDDSHRATGDDGHGWNVVNSRNKSVNDLVGALRQGRFYPSTGVVIDGIAVDGLRIEISTTNGARIVGLRDHGQRFAVADGASISVDVPPDASYVRFECWGIGESFAWTQPFFVAS